MRSKKIINKIKLMVYDFDGVMTDNKVIIDQSGNESVIVNRADGLAVSIINKMGIKQIILSTEKNEVVKKRAKKLGVLCINGIDNKKKVLKDHLSRLKIDRSEVVYVGNDINDLDAMEHVGFAVAPADAHPKIKNIASLVTKAKGGDGVIREVLDIINKQKKGD